MTAPTSITTPPTAYCTNCGDTYATLNGKCTRCGATTVRSSTLDGLDVELHRVPAPKIVQPAVRTKSPTSPSVQAPVGPRTVPGFRIRPLTTEERAIAFSGRGTPRDLEPYLIVLRQMQPGTAYEMAEDGISPRAFRMRMTYAAKRLGKQLRWSRQLKTEGSSRVLELKEDAGGH